MGSPTFRHAGQVSITGFTRYVKSLFQKMFGVENGCRICGTWGQAPGASDVAYWPLASGPWPLFYWFNGCSGLGAFNGSGASAGRELFGVRLASPGPALRICSDPCFTSMLTTAPPFEPFIVLPRLDESC